MLLKQFVYFFYRDKTGRLSDDILTIMIRDQEIRNLLDELSQM